MQRNLTGHNGELRRFGQSTREIFENLLCVICQAHYERDQDIVLNPCGHTFHKLCIEQWWLGVKLWGLNHLSDLSSRDRSPAVRGFTWFRPPKQHPDSSTRKTRSRARRVQIVFGIAQSKYKERRYYQSSGSWRPAYKAACFFRRGEISMRSLSKTSWRDESGCSKRKMLFQWESAGVWKGSRPLKSLPRFLILWLRGLIFLTFQIQKSLIGSSLSM